MSKPAHRKHAIYIDDPVTGERSSLRTLAARHGISSATVLSRYHAGKRGAALIEQHDPARQREEKRQQAQAHAEKLDHMFYVNAWGLACPMRQLGAIASKGGHFNG